MVVRPSIQFHGVGLSYCVSRGYLFGIFMICTYRRWLIILLMLIDLFILQLFFRFYWTAFRKNRLSDTAFSFIIGGFLGNLFDFILFKYVRDFITLPLIRSTNLADTFLFLGLLLLLIELWINKEFRKKWLKLKPLNQELELIYPLFKILKEDFNKIFKTT